MAETAWTRRPLTIDDAEALTALVAALRVDADDPHEPQVEDTREILDSPTADLPTLTQGIWAGDRLVAYARVVVPPVPDYRGLTRAFLHGGVAPTHRGRGLGTDLLRWAAEVGRTRLAEVHPGRPQELAMFIGPVGHPSEDLAAAEGFERVRDWCTMHRRLDASATTPPGRSDLPSLPDLPKGITAAHPTAADEEHVRQAHIAAFQDHWGSAEPTPERWHESWTSRRDRKQYSLLAWEDGEVVAYVLSSQETDRVLHVDLVGTVPAARGRGIAAGLLARVVELASKSGEFDSVDLLMDAGNSSSAPRLYERLGFTTVRRTSTWVRPVAA